MKLQRLGNKRYEVSGEGFSYTGDWTDVLDYMRETLWIAQQEIDFALETMTTHGYDTAHFGVNHMFTHCSDSKATKWVKTELVAIKSLREQFTQAYKLDPESTETAELWQRLMNLYMSLNVDRALEVIENVMDEAA